MEQDGIKLSDDNKKKVIELRKEISQLEQTAAKNINEDKSSIEVKETDLEGLSKERINKMAKVKGKEGYRKLKMIKT